MADKESNQRRSTKQERPLYQAGPKNEQRSKLTHSRDTSVSSVSAKLGTPPAPVDPPGKVDPMEAVGKKLAEMSMRGPPGYFSRSSSDKAKNYQDRPYINNNNTKNNNQQINNYTTNNNRNGHHHSNDFPRHHSSDSLNGGTNAGGRFNTFHGSKDDWNSRNNVRSNDRHFSMPNGGFHDRGSRNDDGRNSFQGDNHRNFNSRNSHYESDRMRSDHNNYEGGRSDRYRDAPGRNQESHDHQNRGDRQGNWRSVPRQNDGGSWRRGPHSQQGDSQRGFRDNHRRLLNGSRDSLHSISSARSNDSRMKRGSPVNNYSQNQSRNSTESTADSPKNWVENGGRRTPPTESELQNHGFNDQTKRGDRARRERRRRSRSQNKKTPKSEQQDESRPQELAEPAEQSAPRRDWCDMADADSVQLAGHALSSDSQEDRAQTLPQPESLEPEIAEIAEKAPEQRSRIDWTECPTPPPLEDTCAPAPIREPTPDPPEIEVKICPYPEESWRNPRSRQTSESSSGQTSNCSGFRKWERQRDGRNPSSRGGRRSPPPRDDFNYSSFHRRAPSPGPRYQDSRDRRPADRYGSSQGKRYSTFQDSLPPRFRKQKENRV